MGEIALSKGYLAGAERQLDFLLGGLASRESSHYHRKNEKKGSGYRDVKRFPPNEPQGSKTRTETEKEGNELKLLRDSH
jgi:hypothetical protein